MSFRIVLEKGRTEKNYWKDLWNYRELFYILSWRDIKVRYKQTTIGVLWAIIRPLLTMIVFAFVFASTPFYLVRSHGKAERNPEPSHSRYSVSGS